MRFSNQRMLTIHDLSSVEVEEKLSFWHLLCYFQFPYVFS